MACAYSDRGVLSQQLITCSRELAALAQKSAELFTELGQSVSAIDSTLGRLSGRIVDLDRKILDAKNAHDAQVVVPGPYLGPHCVPLPPPRRHLSTIQEAPQSESLFAPFSRPLRERLRYASVAPEEAPVPTCLSVVCRRSKGEVDNMKRMHHPSSDSLMSASEKSTTTNTTTPGPSRRSSWRDSFRLPIKRRRRQASNGRPRSVEFAHRHTIACLPPDPPDPLPPPPPALPSHDHNQHQFTPPFPPPPVLSQYPSTTPSSSSLMEYEPPHDRRTVSDGVRRQHAKSTGEMPYELGHQLPLDERVISALVERTLHLSGHHIDHSLHRPQSSHLSVDTPAAAALFAGAGVGGPTERSQSCNGLLEEPLGGRGSTSSCSQPQVPQPPPRNGSLIRASSMPMSPQMIAAANGAAGGGVDPAAVTSKLKRSMSITQRARALFRPVSARRSRSRSKEGVLNAEPSQQRHSAVAGFDIQRSDASSNALDGTGSVERRSRKGRGRSKSPISWLLSRIHPPGQAAHLHPHQRPAASHQQPPRAQSCMEPAFTVMPIEVDDVFDKPPVPPAATPTQSHSNSIFRRRSRSREKNSPKKAVHAVAAGLRLAGLYRPGSRSPCGGGSASGEGSGQGDGGDPTYHRYRTDSDEVDFYVRRHVIDFPSDDADDFLVNFSRLTSLQLHRQALLESIHPQSVASPVGSVGLDQVRHCLHSGRELTRRGRHRHSRRYTDRYSADTGPSTNSGDWSSAEPTPPSPGIVRMQAVRPNSLFFNAPGPTAQQQQPPMAAVGPTSPRLRPVTPGLIGGGISGVGSLAEQLDKLSSQFCNAVSLRKGYKGSGSRSSSGHWSVSTSSLHPKRSSYMSTVGQPTSPMSAGSQPGQPLARSVSKDSALDSSSPCERPSSELVNVAAMRSIEVQTELKSANGMPSKTGHEKAALVGSLAELDHRCLRECNEDDVFCRSSAETLSSQPPEPPPRSASLLRGSRCEDAYHHTNPLYVDTDLETVRSPSVGHSRPGTPGRLEAGGTRHLPVTLPYRSGTLPRNLQARLKSGTDTLKRQEMNYRTEGQDSDSDSDSDSASGAGRRSSSGSDAPPTSDRAVSSQETTTTATSTTTSLSPAAAATKLQYAVIDLDQCSPLPSPTLAPIVPSEKTSASRSPHLSSNSHLSSFSGDSDTGSSCSSANPYHRLYSLSAKAGRADGGLEGKHKAGFRFARNRRVLGGDTA